MVSNEKTFGHIIYNFYGTSRIIGTGDDCDLRN